MRPVRIISVIALAFLWAVPHAQSDERLRVVATFTILGDWAKQIGGDDIDLTTLIQPDFDPHEFDPGPRQQADIATADLVIANGLGLEPWLDRVLDAADFRGKVLIASSGIEPIQLGSSGPGQGGRDDPHAFQDPALAEIYVMNIARALSDADPGNAGRYSNRASKYLAALKTVARAVRDELGMVPQERRKALTSHDAFNYFGRAFGISFAPILLRGGSKEPSASDLASIIEEARRGGYAAIFVENMVDPRLAQSVAIDSGVRIGGELYADALSAKEGPAQDYLSLLRHNAKVLTEALR